MAPGGYTEDELVEQPTIALFQSLGWETANLYHEFTGGKSTEGREGQRDVFLPNRIKAALQRLNSEIPTSGIIQATEQLTQDRSKMIPVNANIRMLGKNGATRYMLMHLTNHDAGRDLMKDCIWKACPENGFYARSTDNPKQQFLIEPFPDLKPLNEWIVGELSSGPLRWQTLLEKNRLEIWRDVQLNKIIRELRKAKVIEAKDYPGRFALKNNPELHLIGK